MTALKDGTRNSGSRFRRCGSPSRRAIRRSGGCRCGAKSRSAAKWTAGCRRRAVSRAGLALRTPDFRRSLTPPRRIELLPYHARPVREGLPTRLSEQSISAGTDLRIGIGPSATLSATVNPDFGQVEADPAVLNLSIFESFFPEKRPFFLEDSRIFVPQYNQVQDFYSRRIGQTPGWFALQSNETLVRKPDNTTILGAAKFTGNRPPGPTVASRR